MNTCKEILQMLADDGLVETEKIGSSVYFWSLPSKALAKKREEVAAAEEEVARAQARNEEVRGRVERARAERSSAAGEDGEEAARRGQAERAIQELAALREKLRAEVEACRQNDPGEVRRWRQESEMAKGAANRWVENIFSLKSWMKASGQPQYIYSYYSIFQ